MCFADILLVILELGIQLLFFVVVLAKFPPILYIADVFILEVVVVY